MSELELTTSDRCDQCGAQAWVRAWIIADKSELLFCGHHWHTHKNVFLARGGIEYDTTDRINAVLDVSPA